jgi:hypothetical protein
MASEEEAFTEALGSGGKKAPRKTASPVLKLSLLTR